MCSTTLGFVGNIHTCTLYCVYNIHVCMYMYVYMYICISVGKEYVCIVRLHDALPSEAKLAQVRNLNY